MNEKMDMEMEQVQETSTIVSVTSQNDVTGGFLSLARQLIDQGKPSEALQAVVMAMRTKGGEEAVFYILQRARELYRSKIQASAEADQLASLFAECAIAEANPSSENLPSSHPPSFPPSMTPQNREIELEAYGNSILAESGRKQIMLDAFSDGTSFICLQCGGLVSNHRKDEHYAYWCQF